MTRSRRQKAMAEYRRAKIAANCCSLCLQRPRADKHSLCLECLETMRVASAERYADRRAHGRCTRCDRPTGKTGTRADPPECEGCLSRRRKRSGEHHQQPRARGGNPGHDLPVGTYRGVRRP